MAPKPVPVPVPKPSPRSVGPTGHLSKIQSFEVVRIHRSDILNAPYNPRRISAPAKKRLRKSLETHGLVEPFVWNASTHHLVGGHQRIALVDLLEGTQDYFLDVARIEVDMPREKSLNILLNNVHAQGAFDPDLMLEFLSAEDAPTLDDLGFTRGELELEIGALPELDQLFPESGNRAVQTAEIADIAQIKQHQRDTTQAARDVRDTHAASNAASASGAGAGPGSTIRTDDPSAPGLSQTEVYHQRRAQHRDRTNNNPSWDTGYFLIVPFASTEDKEAFLEHAGLPVDMQQLDARGLFTELLKPEYANWPEPVSTESSASAKE